MSIYRLHSKHAPKSYEEVMAEEDIAKMRASVFEVSPSMSSDTPIPGSLRGSRAVLWDPHVLTQFLSPAAVVG